MIAIEKEWATSVTMTGEEAKMVDLDAYQSVKAETARLQAELKDERSAQERFAVRVLGQENFDNSPCQAHPLELIENHITGLQADLKRVTKEKTKLREALAYCAGWKAGGPADLPKLAMRGVDQLRARCERLEKVLKMISDWGCNGQCVDFIRTQCPCCIAKQALDEKEA